MKKFKKEPAPDKENLNEDITEAEEEIAAEEEEAKTAAADDEIEKLQAENRQLKEEFLRAYADAENTKKRCAQEIEKNNKYAISSFALKYIHRVYLIPEMNCAESFVASE